MNEKSILRRTLRNTLVEDILLDLAEDVSSSLSSNEVDPSKDDVLTLLGLYGLIDLFQYRRATWLALINHLERLKESLFTDSATLHAATRADFRLNEFEEYICRYITSHHQIDDIGKLHWAAKAYKIILILCGFYVAVNKHGRWTDAVEEEYRKFKRVMEYYIWRLWEQPDEEIPLHSFLAEIWEMFETMVSDEVEE